MSTPEQVLSSEIVAAVGALPGLRLWRQNTGVAYQPISDAGREALRQLARRPGMVRPVHYGLPGSTDYIGLVAPRGRFVGLEVKTERGRLSEQQGRFGAMVQSLGGIWIPARSVDEARDGVARALREG